MGRVFICASLALVSATSIGCLAFDDPAGAGSSIIVTPPDELFTSEGVYEERVFEVRLASPPDADVRLPIEAFPPEEASASVSELVFSPDDWDQPQQFFITSVDDGPGNVDGTRPYEVVLSPLESTDLDFAGIDPPDYRMVNYDADVDIKLFDPADPDQEQKPGLLIYEQTLLAPGESGPKGTRFGVRLTGEIREGTAVTLAFDLVNADGDASFPTEGPGEVHHHEITFTPDDYDTPQYVDIVSLDDEVIDDDEISMEITVITEDPVYDRVFNPEPIAQADDEIFGITTSPTSTNLCEGDSQLVVVALNRPPTSAVEVDYTTTQEGLTVLNGSLRLTDELMSDDMTLRAEENSTPEQNRNTSVTATVTSVDPNYSAETALPIGVTIFDDDVVQGGGGEQPQEPLGVLPQQQPSCTINPI